jgi:tRNA (cytidine/uridine-2'-O-)-methyltransferase
MELHVVLVEPEIPQNTGNIARSCAAVGASLHLIEPLGFSTDSKYVKRAGLDYWHLLEVQKYPALESYFTASPGFQRVFATKKQGSVYTSLVYRDKCSLIFGKETAGLPESLLRNRSMDCARIPMVEAARSLNLSNAAALFIYEVLRQNDYSGLSFDGPGLKSD